MSKEATSQHRLSVMGIEGHAEIIWSIEDFGSIEHAKKMFDDLIAKGYQAFSVERDESNGVSKGGRATKFVPSACELIMVPKVSGG